MILLLKWCIRAPVVIFGCLLIPLGFPFLWAFDMLELLDSTLWIDIKNALRLQPDVEGRR